MSLTPDEQKHLDALQTYAEDDRVRPADEIWLDILNRKTDDDPVSLTGLPTLDHTTGGFRKGQLVVLSGPPKAGKTLLCQNFTKSFMNAGKEVLWFSYELNYEELFGRAIEFGLQFYAPNRMTTGNMEWVEDRILESQLKYGTNIVVVDHLDFLKDPKLERKVSVNMSTYVGSIVRQLKTISVQNNLTTILMSHLKKNDWTTNQLPNSDDLRDTGQTAQLADLVLMMMRYRNDRRASEVYDGNRGQIGVLENRYNGKTVRFDVELKDGIFVETTPFDSPNL